MPPSNATETTYARPDASARRNPTPQATSINRRRELTVMTLLLLWSLGMLATDLVS